MNRRSLALCRFFLAASAFTLAIRVAHAADSPGFYIGAGGGATNYSIDYSSQVSNAYAPTQFVVDYATFGSNQQGGYKLFGGYQIVAPFALEVAYVNLGSPTASYSVHATNGSPSNPTVRNAKYEIQGFNFSAVGTRPLNDAFSVYAMVGAFYSQYKYSEAGYTALGDPYSFTAPNLWKTNLSFGAGATWRFADQWSLRADWDRFQDVGNTFALNATGNGQFNSIDLYSLNLVYRF